MRAMVLFFYCLFNQSYFNTAQVVNVYLQIRHLAVNGVIRSLFEPSSRRTASLTN